MRTNEEAAFLSPSKEAIEEIKMMKKWSLREKLEQIGGIIHLGLDPNFSNRSKSEIDQYVADIWYYMYYLRTLANECPKVES